MLAKWMLPQTLTLNNPDDKSWVVSKILPQLRNESNLLT